MITTRRAGAEFCRGLACAVAFGIAVISGTDALTGVRITSAAHGTSDDTRDLRDVLIDLMLGRGPFGPWSPAAFAAALAVPLLIGAIVRRARVRRRRDLSSQPCARRVVRSCGGEPRADAR